MACEAEKLAFEKAVGRAKDALQAEMKDIAANTEGKTKELSDRFENSNDVAQGVGAAAGTIIGGVFGGPVGAGVGGVVGKAIGSMFVIEVRERLVEFSLDLPEVTLNNQEIIFHVPEVTMRDNDIIFNVPTVVMRTIEGPQVPEIVVEMVLECVDLGIFGRACTDVPRTTVRWKQTFLDVPQVENREQRIVIGLPDVTMKEHRAVVGVPEVAMRTKAMSFTVPEIIIQFAKDAGEKLAEEAKNIAADAAMLVAQKQMSLKDRMRQNLVTPMNAMFDCHRGVLNESRARIVASFDSQLQTFTNSLVAAKAQGLPDGHETIVRLQQKLEELTAERDKQLAPIDAALKTINEAAERAIDNFMAA